MTIKVGDKMPEGTLMTMTESGPQKIAAADYFKGKKVALFALPGAFTPTCSAKHLPGFVQHAEELQKKGVDKIACLSVNDAFVMGAWGQAQQVDGKVDMLADGSAAYTRLLGLTMDASKFGMGERSQRYSMLVEDGVVKVLNVEKPGAFEVSSAEALLRQL